MTSVGETLRQERLRRNLELDQISRELRISARFLEAIEDEHFDRLPGSVFAKSFVRQYARMLGLNEEELAAEAQRMSAPEHHDSVYSEAPPSREEIRVPPMDAWESGGGRRFQWSSSLPALGGMVAVMLICSAVYTWWQRPRTVPPVVPQQTAKVEEPAPPPTQPAAEPAPPAPGDASSATPPETQATAALPPPADATPLPVAQAPPAETPVSQAPPPPPAPAKSVAPPPAAAGAARTVHVELTADEPVWVLARADGKYLFSGTLEANQTRAVDATGSLVLRFGNAGGVSVSLNGKNLGTLGPKGQVRTIQFTSGGFQIVPVAKPPAPVDDPR